VRVTFGNTVYSKEYADKEGVIPSGSGWVQLFFLINTLLNVWFFEWWEFLE
jgi:hypothetical protein